MNLLQQILNKISTLTNTVNAIKTNSVKIEDLDELTELNANDILIVKKYISEGVYEIKKVKISTLATYSTDETLTGGTWIDGKPIYRKVLRGSITTGLIDIDVSDLLMEECKVSGYLNNSNQFFPIGTSANGFYGQAWYYDDTIRIQSSQDIGALIPVSAEYSIILEYTKTTD